jgi:hypothetical protein
MKSVPYLAVLALFILSSCSSAYKTTQTPDDVYYSPRVKPTYAASNNQNNDNVNATDADGDGGTYVTYDDEDQGDYSRRINLFNSNYSGAYYSPNVYSGFYGSPYYGGGWGINSYYGGGFGYGWGSPYYSSFWGPSLSIGFGYGGGWGYNPWYTGWGYNSWYPGGYYGGGYYGGGYWGGHGGYYGYASPGRRTRGSFGTSYPGGRVVGTSPNPGGRTRTDYTPSRRTVGNNPTPGGRVAERPTTGGGRNNGDGYYTPRRSFTPSAGERPVGSDGGGRNSGGTISRPPTRSFQPAQQQPQRSYSPSPSFTPRSSGGNSGGSGGGRVGGGRGRN